jgi:hypothetical protein
MQEWTTFVIDLLRVNLLYYIRIEYVKLNFQNPTIIWLVILIKPNNVDIQMTIGNDKKGGGEGIDILFSWMLWIFQFENQKL